MSVEYSFGNRLDPLGSMEKEAWELTRPRWKQVHGTTIREVTEPAKDYGEVDGLWTRTPNQAIAVVTADCLPILGYHSGRGAVAAIHAGWRGIYSGIIPRFLSDLPESLSDPTQWTMLLGPCIRPCCYEVSESLIEDFVKTFPHLQRSVLEPLPQRLDLAAVALHQIEISGFRTGGVNQECTYCTVEQRQAKYFSYRRGDRNSRQYSWIRFSSKP